MAYIAATQEQFFRTVRIQVIADNLHRDFYVVQRDVMCRDGAGILAAVVNFARNTTRAYEWKEQTWAQGARLYKGEAVDIAKAEAVALSLPFDPKRDVVSMYDIERGPMQQCVACGQDAGHGREPKVCQDCLNAIAAGKAALESTVEGVIEAEDLLSHYAGDGRQEGSLELARLLAKLAGTRVGQDRSGSEHGPIIGNKDVGAGWSGKSRYVIHIAPDKAEAMQQLVDWLNARLDLAYAEGHQDGASVLSRLASGNIGIGDLNEAEARRGKIAQAAHKKLAAIDRANDVASDGKNEG